MKLGTFVVMLLVMLMFLQFVGVDVTGSSKILNAMGLGNGDIENSTLWSEIFAISGILGGLIGVAVIFVGLFTRSYDPSLAILPFIIFIAGLMISAFFNIINYVGDVLPGQDWIINLVMTIFGALGVAFVFSCVDYYAGR